MKNGQICACTAPVAQVSVKDLFYGRRENRPVLKKLAKADETRKADLPNPPESPTGVLTALALVGVALIFLASIGEVLIRIAQVSGWLIIAAAGARFFLEKWPDWALKVTGTVGAWWSNR